ncbi:hypothetical protein JHK85_041003 [Glycine max]|nr:hypothetical protein JHK85_041003 [Glycine max]
MHTHLDICKKKPDIMSKRQKLDSSSTTITLSSSSMIDQEACRIALVKLFVASELSFCTVKHESFQDFFSIVAPFLVVISHITLARDKPPMSSSFSGIDRPLASLYDFKSGKFLGRIQKCDNPLPSFNGALSKESNNQYGDLANLVIPSCRPVKVWQKLQVYARGNDVNLTDYKGKVLAYLNDIYVHVLTMLDLSTKCRVILKSNCYHKEGHQTPCKYGEEVYMMLLD